MNTTAHIDSVETALDRTWLKYLEIYPQRVSNNLSRAAKLVVARPDMFRDPSGRLTPNSTLRVFLLPKNYERFPDFVKALDELAYRHWMHTNGYSTVTKAHVARALERAVEWRQKHWDEYLALMATYPRPKAKVEPAGWDESPLS